MPPRERDPVAEPAYDYVVVGAGPAGCVLASRLSEDASKRVILIEAGPDMPPGAEHPSVRDSHPVSGSDPAFMWPGMTTSYSRDATPDQPPIVMPLFQGYGVGGGSNVYGMLGMRGTPADYDGWRDEGAEGWGWNDVLPHFLKVERDLDFASPLNGTDGRIPVRRIPPERWSPFSKGVADAFLARGLPRLQDANAEFGDGVGAQPMLSLPDRRVSASMAYLDQDARRRNNLTILPHGRAERLILKDRRARGVRVRTPAGIREVLGGEIILCCGALQSPALLMRSGIGPADQLAAAGLEVAQHLPGVGQRLMNHPTLVLTTFLPASSMQDPRDSTWAQVFVRYTSGAPSGEPHDMSAYVLNKTAWHELGRRVGAVIVSVSKPHSVGEVRLRSADPAAEPDVRHSLCDSDFERLAEGARMLLEALSTPQAKATYTDAFLPLSPLVGSLAPRNLRNATVARVITLALSGPAPLRRRLLKSLRIEPESLLGDEAAIKNLVLQLGIPANHVSCTCRIGRSDDPGAVVDAECRVRGIEALRVVDASVMPRPVRAGSHLPVLMIAEKMAAAIRSSPQRRASVATAAAG